MSNNPAFPEHVGTVDFVVSGKTYKTWYKVIGDLKSGKIPLVTLHGGPGLNHRYMLLHKHLWTREKIPVVCYDQIGNGQSSHILDAPAEFWTPELFMDELENLLDHLGIRDNFDLVGQSWGGMLAGHFAAARQPSGLRRLIAANSPASIPLYVQGTNALLEKFPPEFVAKLRKHEADGTTDSKEYNELSMTFLKKHVCTLDPWPEDVMASFVMIAANPTVYHTMLGPSEFNVVGTLKDWDIIDILHRIQAPTLIVGAPNDEVQEPALLPWFLHVPKIKWVELANSTHLGMYEEEDRYLHIVQNFLTG
ncbi:unnamed protein product [Cyclocybe aegerita]|uniref:AB hydrolase-1 domain-containing protein n=1 Tax=Cyclocybe aegerita TaxID=1973307 RepID=A0A8S0X7W4_CYCAE|nr:unnamed protein product [Cyclocybe aegerita]